MAVIPSVVAGRSMSISGVLTTIGDSTAPAGFIGPTIAITITGTFTGTLLWQKRSRTPNAAFPAFQTVRTFVPADFTANAPTVLWTNASADDEYQLVAPAGWGGPTNVFITGGEVQ